MGSTRYIMSIGELTRKDNSLCFRKNGKSVFRGEMTPSKFIQLRKDLNQVIDKDEDFICIIKLMNDNVFGEEVLGNGGEVTGESLMI